MDNTAIGPRPNLFEVVRHTLHTLPEGAPARIEPLRFPPHVPQCRVGSPAAIRARLRDFITACPPVANSMLTLGASGCWPGKRVTVIRLTLTPASASADSNPTLPASWSLHIPIKSDCEAAAKQCPILGQARRVLVVDDEAVSRRLTTGLLKTLGCDTVAVDNGTKAVELASHECFDAIFMDCDMPGLSGYETTAAIRRLESAYTPIVRLGHADEMPASRHGRLPAEAGHGGRPQGCTGMVGAESRIRRVVGAVTPELEDLRPAAPPRANPRFQRAG
jgi:CheY-like chemotaxis protein